jgi:hypothetical protein
MVTYTYNTIKRALDDNAIKLGTKVRTNGSGSVSLSSTIISGIIGYIDEHFFFIFHNDSNHAGGSIPDNWNELSKHYDCKYSWIVNLNNTEAWLEVGVDDIPFAPIVIDFKDVKEGMRIRLKDYFEIGTPLEGIVSFCRKDYACCIFSNDEKFAGHLDRTPDEQKMLNKYNCKYSYGLSSMSTNKIEVLEQLEFPQEINVACDYNLYFKHTLLKGGDDMGKVTIYQITIVDKKDEKITVKKEVAADSEVKALIKFGLENADVLKAVDFKNIEVISATIASFDKKEKD